ncbi:BTE_collapsed_G0011340.mRNA.1.CDS.1 [Saccharomyces cerevisiae]|nr:AIG_G0011360.mRNA.1.CDS.1 [Saccharomyces cerevisiae]CAI5040111.1 BTE_HP_G0089700.mRNA.1.CDS.1 [Saccharomyces cerevisiae]CAI5203393.1 BTE_HP_G0148230.mRNA.1.CDS.1 [Saccharomyces cerevisiae]CAI5211949.1 BTE_HP_G0168890.mRNA.1.CDS.1 [Saccharomyces cerevisiae]CAI5214284.1 BTE_HP_G0176830.mRNA.1.CDS.1 [Saccharomyces cerevisiae]
MDSAKIVNIILSLFLPPVAVFLARGWGTDCIVDIILTILAWFPGMLYALYIVLQD